MSEEVTVSRQEAETRAFYDLLNTVASEVMDKLEPLLEEMQGGSPEAQAAGALAYQLNQYAFLIKQGWVDPAKVTLLVMQLSPLAFRSPGEPPPHSPLSP